MKKLFTFLTLIIGLNTYSQTPAFPCAYGAGGYVTGGRGKTVYHVTSLNETGPGTLKQAIIDATTNGGGTIVFDVSGVIKITAEWYYNLGGNAPRTSVVNTNLSILGQTAPEGGITLDVSDGFNWRFVDFHNVIYRYIKFRGAGTGSFQSWQYTDNIIMDHCSFAWSEYNSTGFTLGSYTDWRDYIPTNITLQNCFMSHTGRGTTIGNTGSADPNPNTLPFGEVSIHRNVYTNNTWRVPCKFGGEGRVDVINNLIESTEGRRGGRQMRFDGQGVKLNHIGNSYSAGFFSGVSTLGPEDLHKMYSTDTTRPTEIYQDDNWYSPALKPVGYDTDNTLDWIEFEQPRTDPLPANWFVSTQHTLIGKTLPVINRANLHTELLPEVGACKYIDNNGNVGFYRDSIDVKYINDIATGNHIDSERAGFGLPVMPSHTRPVNFYQTNPHIPEAWLVANGITGTPTIHNQVQPSGYTLLEVYANQVDTCGNGPVANTCSGKNAPVATISSPSAGNYSKNDTLNFSVNYTSDTTVTSVTYYLNGSVLMSTTNPFTFDTTSLPEGSHTVYAVFTDACGNTSNTDTVIITITGLTVQACNTITPPTIDGVEENIWDNVPQHELAVTENGLPYPDTNTLKANYKVMWDATSLYVFVKVKDDILVMDSPQLDFFRDDAVSIFIDALDNNSSTYDANDYYIGMKQGSSDIIVNNVLYTGGGITKTDVVTIEGYNMEVKIDWAYLGLTPNTTNPIGLDFRVDDDDNGGSREHHLLWNDETSTLWGDPSKFGVLMLTNISCFNTTDIEINNETNLVVYPNPTNGELTIKSSNQINKIEVYNALGSLVYNQNNIKTNSESLNLNKLPKGVYSIKVYQKNKIVEQQLIKQ